MKHLITIALTLVFFVSVSSAEEKPELKDEKDRISYSVGYQIGGDFKKQGQDFNPEAFVKGIQHALSGTDPLMKQQEMNKTLTALKKKVVAAQHEELKKKSEINLKEGRVFLSENQKKEGVKTLPSGLQYKVITEGTGKTPVSSDIVTVHYKGTLLDGSEFDSSYSRGKPATFPVRGVIAGWTEALQLMKEGAKWQLFIPPDLAYGKKGAGSKIGPNSTLIFDVELISIKSVKKNE